MLEEDFSVALLEDDQRDFEAGMVVSTSKVGILWGKKISQFSPQSDEEDLNRINVVFKILSKFISTMSMERKIGQ